MTGVLRHEWAVCQLSKTAVSNHQLTWFTAYVKAPLLVLFLIQITKDPVMHIHLAKDSVCPLRPTSSSDISKPLLSRESGGTLKDTIISRRSVFKQAYIRGLTLPPVSLSPIQLQHVHWPRYCMSPFRPRTWALTLFPLKPLFCPCGWKSLMTTHRLFPFQAVCIQLTPATLCILMSTKRT